MTPVELLARFALAVMLYRDRTNCSVTSWGRTQAHNQIVGGALRSRHLVDLAVDVVYDSLPPLALATQLARELGLTLRREHDHDHLEQPHTEGEADARR